jgi:MraZ protein
MAVPAKFRQRLMDSCQGQLVMTMYQDPCLFVYPLPEWERVEQRLSDLSALDEAAQAIRRLMIGHATDVEMDGAGRVLVPPLLRELAQLDKDVMLIGQGERLEIWSERTWSDQRQLWRDKAARLDATQLSDELKSLKF